MVQLLPGRLTLLLVPLTSFEHFRASYDCLCRSYFGIHGLQRAFIVDEACQTSSFSLLGLGTAVGLERAETLVWIGREPLDMSLFSSPFNTELDQFLRNFSSTVTGFSHSGREQGHPSLSQQDPVSTASSQAGFEIVHRAQDGVYLSVTDSAVRLLEANLPQHWTYSTFPSSPLPLVPVPPQAKDRLRAILKTIRFDHLVASIVNGISVNWLQKDVRYLTGEDPASDILTRHSFSEDGLRAAHWLRARFEETGASCLLKHFRAGFAPNVICEYPASGNATELVILGAHYDDRGSFGMIRAPGANDDGSGTGALLGIARAIARRNVVFRKRVQLCAFAGEEQMMVGSRAYAEELRARGADVVLMVQADMLAYHVAGEPPQLGLSDPALIGTEEVTHILANVSAIYSPELKVGYAPYPGGSDHESFHEQGYPAAQVYERAGYLQDPMYHNSGDLSERDGYDFEQIKSIAKVKLATVLHVAGFDLAADVDGDY